MSRVSSPLHPSAGNLRLDWLLSAEGLTSPFLQNASMLMIHLWVNMCVCPWTCKFIRSYSGCSGLLFPRRPPSAIANLPAGYAALGRDARLLFVDICFHHVSLGNLIQLSLAGSMLTLYFSRTHHIKKSVCNFVFRDIAWQQNSTSGGVMEQKAQKRFSFSALLKKQAHTYHIEVQHRDMVTSHLDKAEHPS